MPVDDVEVHHKVKHTRPSALCYDRSPPPIDPVTFQTAYGEFYSNNMSQQCRQIGRKFNGVWVPLDECLGCKAQKDEQYIEKARVDIDREAARFTKADQRVI